jgi:hypothetical protein
MSLDKCFFSPIFFIGALVPLVNNIRQSAGILKSNAPYKKIINSGTVLREYSFGMPPHDA